MRFSQRFVNLAHSGLKNVQGGEVHLTTEQKLKSIHLARLYDAYDLRHPKIYGASWAGTSSPAWHEPTTRQTL